MAGLAFHVGTMLSDLVGRAVTVSDGSDLCGFEGPKAYATYTIVEDNSLVLLKMDYPVLAALGGALVGLPPAVIKEHKTPANLDETLRDAMHEVLNILSAVLTRKRSVLKNMITSQEVGKEVNNEYVQAPHKMVRLVVAMKDIAPGELSLIVPIA